MRLWLIVVLSLCLSSRGAAQERETIALGEFLVSDKLPDGYEAATKNVKRDGKVVGQTIVVSNPAQTSRVTILCEFKDLPDVESRRAATKAAFQDYRASLVKLGYKTVDKNIPDFDQVTFEPSLSMTVHFFNDERKLWTHNEFFFTDKAFWVRASADNPQGLEEIKKWAVTVKPKPKP